MIKNEKSISQLSRAFRQFRSNRLAIFCLWTLILIHAAALFADLMAPYSFRSESRVHSYAPPSRVHFVNDQGKWQGPFVYGLKFSFNEYHRRIYEEDRTLIFPIKFFSAGEAYQFLGVIPGHIHLFTVDMPGRIYLWGADARGRDIFSRIWHGARISLSIGLIGVLISFFIGLLVGGAAGYYGGVVDDILMRICEMFMMFPGFYLLLALRAVVPPEFNSVQVYFAIIIILSFIGWASLARVIRGMYLSLKEREYVLAAKTLGLSDLAIILRHILPHTLSYSLIAIMLSIPGYILAESALSLIGLGIQDPFASWGNSLAEAMSIVQIQSYPWILAPGYCIFATVMCFNIVGDALRDALDPKAEWTKG